MQGIQIIDLLDTTPPLAQADVLHINKASNSNDEKYSIGALVRDKTVANLIQGSTQLINNGSTANALVFDIESGIVDLESAETRVFYFTAPFTSTGTGTFTINGVTGATNLPSKIMKKGVLANIKAGTIVINQIYQVFIDGGNAIFTTSSGGLSTSYNGAVVNAATSVITLTNADTDIDNYEVFKQGVKITITPDITTTADAVVTLSGSNLTSTPIFIKNISTGVYSQIGLSQQLIAGVPFDVVYINNQPSVNGGLPFLLTDTALPVISLPAIIGNPLLLSYSTTTTFNCSAGYFRFSDGTAIGFLPVQTPINLSTTGLNGMDTGTIPANAWLYIYALYNPATGQTGVVASLNNTTPTLPAGYTQYSRIKNGFIRVTSSVIVNFVHYATCWKPVPRYQIANQVNVISFNIQALPVVPISSHIVHYMSLTQAGQSTQVVWGNIKPFVSGVDCLFLAQNNLFTASNNGNIYGDNGIVYATNPVTAGGVNNSTIVLISISELN